MKFRPTLALILIICIITIFNVQVILGATHYVSNSGIDSGNALTPQTAWRTCGYMMSHISGGDTVLFMGGTYAEDNQGCEHNGNHDHTTLYFSSGGSGTLGHPTVLKCAPGYSRPVIKCTGGDYANFGIQFFYASYIVLDSLILTKTNTGITLWDECYHLTFKNCVVDSTGGYSDLMGDNCAGVLSLKATAGYITVQACSLYYNNISYAQPTLGVNVSGILMYFTDHWTITDNDIFNQTSTQSHGAIYVKGGPNTYNEIENNRIHDCAANGIMLYYGVCNNLIHNNLLWNLGGEGIVEEGVKTVYSTSGDRYNKIYNNTIYGCADGLVWAAASDEQTPDTNIQVFNNIVVNPSFGVAKSPYFIGVNSYLNYNCYYGETSNHAHWDGTNYNLPSFISAIYHDSNSVEANPHFFSTNPSNANFLRLDTASVYSSEATRIGGRGGSYPTYMGAINPDAGPPPPQGNIDQVITKNSTQNSVTLIDDLSGGTAPYDSLVLHWSTTRAAVVNLVARDTRVVSASDPYSFIKSSLNTSTKYYFRILAYDSGATADTSAIDSVTTLAAPPPPAIDQNAIAVPADTTVNLIDNITGGTAPYDSLVLYWSATQANVANLSARDTHVTAVNSPYSFIKSNLTSNTRYYFRISAFDTGSIGDTTVIDSVLTTMAGLALLSVNVPDTESGTYAGYSTIPVNDGAIDPRGGTSTTWASDDIATNPHWVEMDFDGAKYVRRVKIFWAWNSYSSSWMSSQQFNIQYWDSSSGTYQDAAVVNNNSVDSITTIDFNPILTSKVRYYQPANMGPPNYTRILWLTELQFYGQTDTIPPAAIQDLH